MADTKSLKTLTLHSLKRTLDLYAGNHGQRPALDEVRCVRAHYQRNRLLNRTRIPSVPHAAAALPGWCSGGLLVRTPQWCRPAHDVQAVTSPPPHALTTTLHGCSPLIRDLQLEGLSLKRRAVRWSGLHDSLRMC